MTLIAFLEMQSEDVKGTDRGSDSIGPDSGQLNGPDSGQPGTGPESNTYKSQSQPSTPAPPPLGNQGALQKKGRRTVSKVEKQARPTL